MPGRWVLAGLLLLMTGCVERTLTVKSDPPEALLTVNGAEVGRTPFKHDFIWYGTYDLELRKPGYDALKTRGKVIAPWWQWVPFDLLAELAPFELKDHQELDFTLRPHKATQVDPYALLKRAESMPPLLESSEHTRAPLPATLPTTRPTTKKSPTRKSATTRPSQSHPK